MGCVYGKCCRCDSCFIRRHRAADAYGVSHHQSGQHGGQTIPVFSERSLELIPVPSHNFRLEYSVLTQRGYYPDSPDKDNQDSYCIKTQLNGDPNIHFFGVFDGHGQFGSQCANFVRDRLVEVLSTDPTLVDDPVKAYTNAFLATNDELHNSDIDDTMSGTTAITVLVIEDTLYVANVGDSRAVIASKDGNQIIAKDLSRDQTPFRKDECERVKRSGARVLTVDQVEGIKDPTLQNWGDEETEGNDPPRLWVQNGMYPGTAFTRSVGDSTAEKIGVVAVPEVSVVQLSPQHQFFVVASDGVFEFLSSQTVVNMVARHPDPRDACSTVAGESYKQWLEHESRTDDITLIVVQIKGLSSSGGGLTSQTSNGDPRSTITDSVESLTANESESESHLSLGNGIPDRQLCRPAAMVDSKNAALVTPSLV